MDRPPCFASERVWVNYLELAGHPDHDIGTVAACGDCCDGTQAGLDYMTEMMRAGRCQPWRAVIERRGRDGEQGCGGHIRGPYKARTG